MLVRGEVINHILKDNFYKLSKMALTYYSCLLTLCN